VEVSLSRAYAALAQACLWGYRVPRSSPGPHLPKPYGRRPLVAPGALLISPFNMKWRFSAPTGDVEGSKLCLFSVIMPAKSVSSVSPRFHYSRVAFCFLPLAAILEFLQTFLTIVFLGYLHLIIDFKCFLKLTLQK
jgi:hypothetical protein